jgi:AraC-like DNA-binding protein
LKRNRHIDAGIRTAIKAASPLALPLNLNLLSAAFDALIDCPFFLKDRALRYTAVNRAMTELCGVAGAEILGKTAGAFFGPTLARHYEALDRLVLRSGEPVMDRLEISAAISASPQWLLFSRFPVPDADGAVVGVLGVARRLALPDARHPKYARLAKIARRLRQNVDGTLRVASLARDIGISSSQLERDFRQVFGIPLQQFHRKLRIEKAMHLMKARGSIAEIAHACGFADHAAFSRRFKAATGMTPTQYRQLCRSAHEPRGSHSRPAFSPVRR